MRSARPALQRLTASLFLAALVAAGTGCQSYPFTYALWKESELARHCEPAPRPNLQLYQSLQPHDILVQYDELRERDDAVRRRAFFLQANLSRLEAHRRPRFVSLDQAGGLAPIPVGSASGAATNFPAGAVVYATMSSNGFNFTLHSAGGTVSEFHLPAYQDRFSTAQRALLTPLTVVSDVVVGAVAVGTVLGLIWLSSGAPGLSD